MREASARVKIRTSATHHLRLLLIVVTTILVATSQSHVAFTQETNIVVSNGKTRIIENIPAILTGDILVEKNSTLVMRNVMLQLSVRGERAYNITVKDRSTLVLRKSNIVSLHTASNITVRDSSTLIVEDRSSVSGFQFLRFENASLVSLQDTALGVSYIVGSMNKLELLRVAAAGSTVNITSPTVSIDTTALGDLDLRTTQLDARSLRTRNLRVQCTRARLNDIQAQRMSINATEEVYASGVRVTTSNVYALVNTMITDSTFGTLTLGLRGQLYNVTTSRSPLIRAGGMIYTYQNSTIRRYWNLKANVTDITMMPVPATIEIRDHNMTLVDSAKVGVDGTVSKPILSEIITNSVPTFIGNYKISAHFKSYATNPETIVLDTNKRMNLVFADEIPGLASVTLTITPQLILTGDKITVKGKIRVPVKDNIVELTYVTPDGLKLTRAATTNQDGAFTHELNVDVGGKWKVQAYWLGGEPYSEGIAPISRPMTFEVLSRQSMLNLVVFMIPILIVLIVAIVAIALLLLKRRGPSPVLRPRRPKRSWHIRRARTKQTP